MRLYLFMFLMVFAACSSSMQSFSGETSLVEGAPQQIDGLRLELLNVVEDSRCPQGVECFWAGRFVANLSVQSASFSGPMLISSVLPTTFTDKDAVYTLQVVQVFPDPAVRIDVDRYRVTVAVTEKVKN